MKSVKQFFMEVMVDENVDGCELAEQLAEDLENEDHMVLSSVFLKDVSDKYRLFYPELSTEGYRTIKFTAGMMQEFEIISTNAPDSVIKANLQYISSCEEAGEQIENPYAVIEAMGFVAKCLGCQDDFDSDDMERAIIDAEFDYYNF